MTHLVRAKVDVEVSLVVSVHGSRERRPRPLERQHALDVVAGQLLSTLGV